MPSFNLKFSDTPSNDSGSYKLLELPPELCKLVESSLNGTTCFTVKGQASEDAVLCTEDKTYTLRSVVLSNSVLVVTPPDSSTSTNSQDIVIRDQLHEVLEAIPSLPKLQKLNSLLRGSEYDEGHEEDDEEMDVGDTDRPAKRQKLTYEDAKNVLQASDIELSRGLRERRVLRLNGLLRPIAPSHLTTILELLLNALVSLSLPHQNAPVEDLLAALEDDHEIKRDVARQVMTWFGTIDDGKWCMDTKATVKEVGLGLLRAYRHEAIDESEFLVKWRTTVGDTFEAVVDLKLLSGNYISRPSSRPLTLDPGSTSEIFYFPASTLPQDPAARFADLFLTRPRWKADDIAPFLADIVVDNKERDRLLLKYARAVTDAEGVWYTARVKA